MGRVTHTVVALGAFSIGLAGCASGMSGNDTVSASPATTATPASSTASLQSTNINGTIGTDIINNPNLSEFVTLLQKANMVETLNGAGPFTVLAPNNDAFTRVPSETRARMNSDNALLARALSYHVLRGKYTRSDIVNAIRSGGGAATFITVNGATLRARIQNEIVVFEGNNNSIAYFQQVDVPSSNGVVHAINGVLIPPSLG